MSSTGSDVYEFEDDSEEEEEELFCETENTLEDEFSQAGILYNGTNVFTKEINYTIQRRCNNFSITKCECKDAKICTYANLWRSYFKNLSRLEEGINYTTSNFQIIRSKMVNESMRQLYQDDSELISIASGRKFCQEDDRYSDVEKLVDFHNWVTIDCIKMCCFVCGRYTGRYGICGSEVCTLNYTENPLFQNWDDFNSELYSLFSKMFRCSLHSPRSEVLIPYLPSWVSTHAQFKEEFDKIKSVLDLFTPITINEAQYQSEENAFAAKRELEIQRNLQKNLVWWVYTFLQCYGTFMKANPRELGYTDDFEVFSYKSYSEPQFSNSRVAYHGSPCGNWVSILTNGLQNLSGTRHQINGAVYGAGVYAAPDFSTSQGYARNTSGEPPIVAQLEITDDHVANPYFVIQNRDKIRIKYLVIG